MVAEEPEPERKNYSCKVLGELIEMAFSKGIFSCTSRGADGLALVSISDLPRDMPFEDRRYEVAKRAYSGLFPYG